MIEQKIYVPDMTNYKCFVVSNSDTIRAYKSIPTSNSEVVYRDYYINSHYVFKDGTQSFGNYSNYLPTCVSESDLTTSIYYRNDFDSILMIFFIIVLVSYFIVKKIIRGFFLGFKYC